MVHFEVYLDIRSIVSSKSKVVLINTFEVCVILKKGLRCIAPPHPSWIDPRLPDLRTTLI